MNFRQAGFAYLYLLFAVAILSVMLLAGASVHHYEVRRQQEVELIRIGREFRHALVSYRAAGNVREFPASFEDLLLDRRLGANHRHLRRIYVDPMTRSEEWGLIREHGRIVGVHSLSSGEPIKLAGFDPEEAHFEGARRYSEWRFMVSPNEIEPVDAIRTPGRSN